MKSKLYPIGVLILMLALIMAVGIMIVPK